LSIILIFRQDKHDKPVNLIENTYLYRKKPDNPVILSKNLYLNRKNTINALILSIIQKRWKNRFLGKYHYCAYRRRSRLKLIIAGKTEQTVRFPFIAPIISTENRFATRKYFFRHGLTLVNTVFLATESTETQRNNQFMA